MRKDSPTESQTFKNLVHFEVVVKDLDQAVKRLESLGIGPFKALSMPPFTGTPTFRGKPLNAKVKGVFADAGGIKLGLAQPIEGESPWMEFLDNRGEGIHHVAFAVDDLDKEVAKLTKQGCSVLKRSAWQGGGSAYIDLGVGSIVIELEKWA
jgi:methylmalonyl-CoA/ethylmalonyl-CoA epimerase